MTLEREGNLFINEIQEYYDESDIPAICEAFENHSISIEPDDLPQRLCEIYRNILTKAAKGERTVKENRTDIQKKHSKSC